MTYGELKAAVAVFGLGPRATLKEIKSRHRELVKRHHPDSAADDDPESIRKVNEAYQVLLAYLSEYHFCFDEEEFYEQNPEERLRRQFMEDPLWGGGR